MKIKSETYILRLPNMMLKTFTGMAVQSLLNTGELDPYDYLFVNSSREWLRPADMEGVFQIPIGSEEKVFEKPSFMPPPSPVSKSSSDDHELKQKIEELSRILEQKESVINALKETRGKLEKDFYKIVFEKDEIKTELETQIQVEENIRTELINANIEIEELNEQIQNLEKQVDDLLNIKDELLEIKADLDQKYILLAEELDEKEQSFNSYKADNQALEERLDELEASNQKLLKKQSIYRDYIKNEKRRADTFESNVNKLNEGIIKLKSLRKKDQITIQNLEDYKKTQSTKEARELNQLIGDSFEIDNSAHWYIEMDGEVKGPFSFHDMKSLQKYGKIDNDTPVKKSHDAFWASAGRDFELTANLITHSEVVGGKEVFRYFVSRAEYRAPFHGAAVIQIDGKDYTGFCTSLSSGGAFIELASLEEEMIHKGEIAQLRINAGTLSEDLEATVVLRNFSKEKPCGIGLQFQSLDDEQRNVILSYVSSYLENIKKTA